MFRTKDVERRCVSEVARARGATARDEAGSWPDGWVLDPTEGPIAVEVVSAFPETDGERWARRHVEAGRAARRLSEETGEPVSWMPGVVLDGATAAVRTRPVDPITGILGAIDAKAGKYGREEAMRALLVVHHVQWPWGLDDTDLRRVANHAQATRVPFREIWIVNEFGDPAQRVPTA